MQLLEDKLEEEAGWPEQERSLFQLDAIGMWTKLRPGVRALLAQLAPLFQLWIFTNGTRCRPTPCELPGGLTHLPRGASMRMLLQRSWETSDSRQHGR